MFYAYSYSHIIANYGKVNRFLIIMSLIMPFFIIRDLGVPPTKILLFKILFLQNLFSALRGRGGFVTIPP